MPYKLRHTQNQVDKGKHKHSHVESVGVHFRYDKPGGGGGVLCEVYQIEAGSNVSSSQLSGLRIIFENY